MAAVRTFFITAVVLVVLAVLLKSLLELPTYTQQTHDAYSTQKKRWRQTPSRNVDGGDSIHTFKVPSTPVGMDLAYLAIPDIQPIRDTSHYYGLNSTELRRLVSYWKTTYNYTDSPTMQALRALPHFSTNVNGLSIHFIHDRYSNSSSWCQSIQSNQPIEVLDTTPRIHKTVLLLHGWPGSVLEFLQLINIYKQTCFFDEVRNQVILYEIIAPSLPGYGYSDAAEVQGMDTVAMAEVFLQLMQRLEKPKYVISAGDWGGIIAATMAQIDVQSVEQGNSHIERLHLNFLTPASSPLTAIYLAAASILPPEWVFGDAAEVSRARMPVSYMVWHLLDMSGYMHAQATRPDSLALAISANPVGIAAWILDKFAEWSDLRATSGSVIDKYSEDWLISNILLYVQAGVAPSLRLYKESFNSARFFRTMMSQVTTPTCAVDFPFETVRNPTQMLTPRFTSLLRMNGYERGGHFAALEEPNIMARDLSLCLVMDS